MAVRMEMRLELHAILEYKDGCIFKTEKIDDVWSDVEDVSFLRGSVPAGFVYVTPSRGPFFRTLRKA